MSAQSGTKKERDGGGPRYAKAANSPSKNRDGPTLSSGSSRDSSASKNDERDPDRDGPSVQGRRTQRRHAPKDELSAFPPKSPANHARSRERPSPSVASSTGGSVGAGGNASERSFSWRNVASSSWQVSQGVSQSVKDCADATAASAFEKDLSLPSPVSNVSAVPPRPRGSMTPSSSVGVSGFDRPFPRGHSAPRTPAARSTATTPSGSPLSSTSSRLSAAASDRDRESHKDKGRRNSAASAVSQGSTRHGPYPPGGVAGHSVGGGGYKAVGSPTASSVSAKSNRGSGSSSPSPGSRDDHYYDEPEDDDCKYKTELCRTWMENRTCAYGGGCAYAHGYEDLRERPRIETFKSTPCTDPARQNFHKCDYGARCNYVHPGEAVRRAFGDRKYFDKVYFEALERDFPYNKYPFGIYI